MVKFEEPFLPIDKLIEILIKKGLIIKDENEKKFLYHCLSTVSYYRLKTYFEAFQFRGDPRNFFKGTTLETIWHHYGFDRRMRIIVLDAIERVEIAIRAQIINFFSLEHEPFDYLKTENYAITSKNAEEIYKLIDRIRNEIDQRYNEKFVLHFREKYGNYHKALDRYGNICYSERINKKTKEKIPLIDLPIWMAFEGITFTTLSLFYKYTNTEIRDNIAQIYGINSSILTTWLHSLVVVRNICTHHSPLWNKEFNIFPSFPKNEEIWHKPVDMALSDYQKSLFGILTILHYMVKIINPKSEWTLRLYELINLSEYADVSINKIGFPENWKDSRVWNYKFESDKIIKENTKKPIFDYSFLIPTEKELKELIKITSNYGINLKATELDLGAIDAETYIGNEERLNKIFTLTATPSLDDLLKTNIYFLLGEKGTGKTAYSLYLNSHPDKRAYSYHINIRNTDFMKFYFIKKTGNLPISDYKTIWKVILLKNLAERIKIEELNKKNFMVQLKYRQIKKLIKNYEDTALSPEFINNIEQTKEQNITLNPIMKYITLALGFIFKTTTHLALYQSNLTRLERQFSKIVGSYKLKIKHILFIDGLDNKISDEINTDEYLTILRDLGQVIWQLNKDFFSKDEKARKIKVVLITNTLLFELMDIPEADTKVSDNSVILKWKKMENYKDTGLYNVIDNLLSHQPISELTKLERINISMGLAWDHYFPWTKKDIETNNEQPSFYWFQKYSYNNPRDILKMMHIQQELIKTKEEESKKIIFSKEILFDQNVQQNYSTYLLESIKKQLAFQFCSDEINTIIHFFSNINQQEFSYDEYLNSYKAFHKDIKTSNENSRLGKITADDFLQLLYKNNFIGYMYEKKTKKIQWAYEERNRHNINSQVITGKYYSIHIGLVKALKI